MRRDSLSGGQTERDERGDAEDDCDHRGRPPAKITVAHPEECRYQGAGREYEADDGWRRPFQACEYSARSVLASPSWDSLLQDCHRLLAVALPTFGGFLFRPAARIFEHLLHAHHFVEKSRLVCAAWLDRPDRNESATSRSNRRYSGATATSVRASFRIAAVASWLARCTCATERRNSAVNSGASTMAYNVSGEARHADTMDVGDQGIQVLFRIGANCCVRFAVGL
jgi:hypothetical protein